MLFRVSIDAAQGIGALTSPVMRYELIERLAAGVTKYDGKLLAFGLGDGVVRMVVECAEEEAVGRMTRGFKVGTTRAAVRLGHRLTWWTPIRTVIPDTRAALEDAIVWAHRAPVELGSAPSALATPWSSHRDLLGFRVAAFYDPRDVVGRVDVGRIARLTDRHVVPAPRAPATNESLAYLLRVAASVLGVLPADRRCFRLFVHLAKARGWQTSFVADALTVTTRRIRQLAQDPEPLLPTAIEVLGDARLCRVP
jgi:hypothetical protein